MAGTRPGVQSAESRSARLSLMVDSLRVMRVCFQLCNNLLNDKSSGTILIDRLRLLISNIMESPDRSNLLTSRLFRRGNRWKTG